MDCRSLVASQTQKSICKQLMEPYHLYHFIDDPLAKIKVITTLQYTNRSRANLPCIAYRKQ